MKQNNKPDDKPAGARIDDGELADDGSALPGEGHGDPLTQDEPTALEERRDPATGMPTSREALR